MATLRCIVLIFYAAQPRHVERERDYPAGVARRACASCWCPTGRDPRRATVCAMRATGACRRVSAGRPSGALGGPHARLPKLIETTMQYDLVLAARDARRAGDDDARRRHARGLRRDARGRRHADGEQERRRQRSAGRAGGPEWARGRRAACGRAVRGRARGRRRPSCRPPRRRPRRSLRRRSCVAALAPRTSPPRPAARSCAHPERRSYVRPRRAVRSDQDRTGQIRSDQSRPGWARLGWARLGWSGQIRPDQIRSACVRSDQRVPDQIGLT